LQSQLAILRAENARLSDDLRARTQERQEAREYQTATSDVLNVISRSPTDVQPVFDMIAHSAARLCQARFCHVFRFDGELVHFVAHHGLDEEGREQVRADYPLPPSRASAATRSVLSGVVEEIPDIEADTEYQHTFGALLIGYRSIMAVPMLKDGRPIGAVAVAKTQTGRFPEQQVELLQTFADQAVIAIENARLFEEVQARTRELQESLEYQTATSDVLNVISRSPSQIQPVLETIAETARRLCEAYDALIFLRQGDWLSLAAHRGPIPLDLAGWPVERGWVTGRAVVDRVPAHVHDLTAAGDEFPVGQSLALRSGHRTTLATPLLREGDAIGAIVIRRTEVRPFSDRPPDLRRSGRHRHRERPVV